MNLTEKEAKAFKAIVDNALDNMGGKTPADLHHDNFSWFRAGEIMDVGFSRHEAAGLMSSLNEKGLVFEADRPDWAMTEGGIDVAETLWGTKSKQGEAA